MKNESNKNLLLGGLIIGLVSMTVAFAAFSTSLNIAGTVKVSKMTWRVKIDGWQKKSGTGEGVTVKEGNITDTSISGYKFDFSEPGTSITYDFYIKNYGTINAQNKSISVATPNCMVNGERLQTCPVTFEVKCDGSVLSSANTSSGTLMKTLSKASNGTPVSNGISTCTYKVSFDNYNYNISGDITVDNLDVSWTYTQ